MKLVRSYLKLLEEKVGYLEGLESEMRCICKAVRAVFLGSS